MRRQLTLPIPNRLQEVMEHLVDSLGYLLKGHGPAYLNFFDTVTAPVFGPLLESSQPASLRWALSQLLFCHRVGSHHAP